MNPVIESISRLMCEMDPTGLTGGISMQNQPSIMTLNQAPNSSQQEDENYSEADLELAKQFISSVGGPDRAQSLLDKTIECQECLGVDRFQSTPAYNSNDAAQMISSFMDQNE